MRQTHVSVVENPPVSSTELGCYFNLLMSIVVTLFSCDSNSKLDYENVTTIQFQKGETMQAFDRL